MTNKSPATLRGFCYTLFMIAFKVTTHLSEILEESKKMPVIIFKYSSECGSSARLKNKLDASHIEYPVYLITVQKERTLSNKISDWFNLKHESPQILIINGGKITYSAHHNAIDPLKFVYK